MLNAIEPRRVGARQSSECSSLGGDSFELNALSVLNQQAAWLKQRYPAIGEAHARVIAEHAFSKGALR